MRTGKIWILNPWLPRNPRHEGIKSIAGVLGVGQGRFGIDTTRLLMGRVAELVCFSPVLEYATLRMNSSRGLGIQTYDTLTSAEAFKKQVPHPRVSRTYWSRDA